MYANEVETKKNIKITGDKKLSTTYILNKASIIVQILPMQCCENLPNETLLCFLLLNIDR